MMDLLAAKISTKTRRLCNSEVIFFSFFQSASQFLSSAQLTMAATSEYQELGEHQKTNRLPKILGLAAADGGPLIASCAVTT